MEQSPGSVDNLQPQDLSSSSNPPVIDLTRNGDECVLNAASFEALRMVRGPGWYTNSAASNPGLPLSEPAPPATTIQSGEHVQPDNAFSHATVTLSYVSRSHIFSANDSTSRHPPLYGVPPISKFPLLPSCDLDNGLGETRFSLNQHFVVEGPLDLAIQPELLQSISQTDVAVCLTQEPLAFNCGVFSCNGDVDEPGRDGKEARQNQENGGDHSASSPVSFANSSADALTPRALSEEKGSLGVLLCPSKKQELVLIQGRVAAGDLRALSMEYNSPLEDPVSPSVSSLDDVKEVFSLPQASCSPSAEDSCLEAAEEVSGPKAQIEPIVDSTDDVCVSSISEDKPQPDNLHTNGDTKALQRTVKEKRLPLRSSRGTRLEAIVMDINSSKYNVSGRICSKKKANSSTPAPSNSQRKETQSGGGRRSKLRTGISRKSVKQKAANQLKRDKTNNLNFDCTSVSKSLIVSKDSQSRPSSKHSQFTSLMKPTKDLNNILPSVYSPPPPTSPSPSKSRRLSQSSPQSASPEDSKKGPTSPSSPEPLVKIQLQRLSPVSSESVQKSPAKAKDKAAGSKTSPTAKTRLRHAVTRRRRKPKGGESSWKYFPAEPEIKLKYVNYKEEKRELRTETFSPFVRVERCQSPPALCTVINYPEVVRTQPKKIQQQRPHGSAFISADVPSTSCLQLGRPSTHSQLRRSLVCCLCGQSANAMDLGDLHGPYYPDGYQAGARTPAGASRLKEENSSDSDSSSSSVSDRPRKRRSVSSSPWPPKQNGALEGQWWSASGKGGPAAKRARSHVGAASVEDWYSPPVLPHELCEHWLHEDCGIWSAGVFLVKGKVYGLEEAVRTAQEMMCSACQHPGATLGCFFKGCPNKYHYRCALESECVLNEDNFSMKCKKHKDKLIKGSARNRVVNSLGDDHLQQL